MKKINPLLLIERFYPEVSESYHILIQHSTAVTQAALLIAHRLEGEHIDRQFIEEAAMLHDIGIFMTWAPQIGCKGEYPYIAHGYLGRQILEAEGLDVHALVCENHVGAGITIEEIDENNLPIPRRDMLPLSIEEKIICYADKFFSKRKGELSVPMSMDKARSIISSYGESQLNRFDQLANLFGILL